MSDEVNVVAEASMYSVIHKLDEYNAIYEALESAANEIQLALSVLVRFYQSPKIPRLEVGVVYGITKQISVAGQIDPVLKLTITLEPDLKGETSPVIVDFLNSKENTL